jgi:hypothetical protein
MVMLKKLKKLSLLSALGGMLAIFGCKKDQMSNPVISPESVGQSIRCENGYLVFKDEIQLKETINLLSTKNEAEKDLWEKQFNGFKSMRYAFGEVVKEELAFQEKLENGSQGNTVSIDGIINDFYTALAEKYKTSVFIATLSDGSKFLDKNIHTEPLSYVINEKGLLKVGDKLFQHTRGYIKSTKNILNVNALEKSTHINESEGVEVQIMHTNRSHDMYKTMRSWVYSNTVTGYSRPERKIILYEDFIQNTSGSNTATTYAMTVRNLKRSFGTTWWVDDPSFTTLSGTYNGNYIPTSGQYSTWSSGNVHTLYYVAFEILTDYATAPNVTTATHTATREGGSSGLSVVVSH